MSDCPGKSVTRHTTVSEYSLGDMTARYVTDETGKIGLILVPSSLAGEIDMDKDCAADSFVQLKLAGDAYPGTFGNGATMHDSGTVNDLRLANQSMDETPDSITITTCMVQERFEIEHKLIWYKGYEALESYVIFRNTCAETLSLEMLHSFCLCMLTPFEKGVSRENILVHRLRSKWAYEASHESLLTESLNLTPAYIIQQAYSERFGERGNKPTNVFMPFVGVEDIKRGVLWGAQLGIGASWQIELFRRDNGLSISGGLPDYDFGHWLKDIVPGKQFISPSAYLTTCEGDIDELCHRLVYLQQRPLSALPASEQALSVICNEWMTTCGNPTYNALQNMVEIIKNRGIKYFVIDAGWYKNAVGEWDEYTGDWLPSPEKYPQGFRKATEMIRQAGLIPGLWFEFETSGVYSELFKMDEHLLHRFGKPVISYKRKFLDLKDPWVWEYLCDRVIGLMAENGIGYMKIDSNECSGIGNDGCESLGEGARQQAEMVEAFIKEIRRRIPEIVIENCSSGGMRLVPNMMALCGMASFSDAFETRENPIIAASVQRVILPRQSQIWAVLREKSDDREMYYALASAFLGRMCVTGDLCSLDAHQLLLMDRAIECYSKAVAVIKNGKSRICGPKVINLRQPEGWQAVIRKGLDTDEVLAVVHTFGDPVEKMIEIPLFEGDYGISWCFCRDSVDCSVKGGKLCVKMNGTYEGAVIMLKKNG